MYLPLPCASLRFTLLSLSQMRPDSHSQLSQAQLLDIFPSSSHGENGSLPQLYNAEGVYAIRFKRGGSWKVVVVDDWIPCNE